MPKLILASSSRYRQSLLARLKIPFEAIAPALDESPLPTETALETTQRLALAKAQHIARAHPDAFVLGSDQLALCAGATLGKPGDHARALAQLEQINGQQVVFHTAVALVGPAPFSPCIRVVDTVVTMRRLSRSLLDAYLRIEQPYDCAGSAKNEGLGIALMQSIATSDPTALTGLPLITVCDFLNTAQFALFTAPQLVPTEHRAD